MIISAGSSNGRTAAFGAVCGGSNPPPAAILKFRKVMTDIIQIRFISVRKFSGDII